VKLSINKHATPRTLNVAGLVMSLVGIVLMFVFGAPLFVRTGTDSMLLLEGVNEHVGSWIGLVLVVAGVACIVVAERRRTDPSQRKNAP
jgi:hypothetical protein